MMEMITVRFKPSGRQFYFDPRGKRYLKGTHVIVETVNGKEYAVVEQENHQKDTKNLAMPVRPVLGKATPQEKKRKLENDQRAKEALRICKKKVKFHKLSMSLIDVEASFEGNKILFYFSAENRVDFRALVRDLATTLRARIELRQIGVRDEAKILGGLGICGRPYCCNLFLDRFAPVSIKMAKTQNLSLNPTKISGACGRLMCCLKYEQEAYVDLLKTTPRSDSFVETPDGAGTINSVNLLRQMVSVKLESDPSKAQKYHNSEIVVIRSGRGRRPEGYVQPPLAQLEKQRRVVERVLGEKPPQNSLAAALEAMLNPPVVAKGKPPKPGNKSQKHPPGAPPKQGKPPQKQGNKPQGNKPPQGKFQGGKNQAKPKKKDKHHRPNNTRPNRNNKRGAKIDYDMDD